jgi:hypothetical protein
MTDRKALSYTKVKRMDSKMDFFDVVYGLIEFALLAEELYGENAYNVTETTDALCVFIIETEG